MKKLTLTFCVLLLCAATGMAQSVDGRSADGLKVFISVDMEGITGVVNWEEVSRDGKDYDYFRRIMTLETNAAIEGAITAGATHIVVRDSHGSARNILPELLDRRALLLRDWSGGPKSMMEGIDETFDAVVFIGYHAKAGTPDALLEHTMTGNVMNISINGISMPEAGINALIAGHYNVPVAFGAAALNLRPAVAREKIRSGVTDALQNLGRYRSYKLRAPFTMVLTLKEETTVYPGQYYPGAERTGEWEITYRSDEIMQVILAFAKLRSGY